MISDIKVIGGILFWGFSIFKYMIELSEPEQSLFTEFTKLAPLSKYRGFRVPLIKSFIFFIFWNFWPILGQIG